MSASRRYPRSSIYLSHEQVQSLRDIAEKLGYFQTRGVGTGEVGSVSALLAGVAWAYQHDPTTVVVELGKLLSSSKADTPPEELRYDASIESPE